MEKIYRSQTFISFLSIIFSFTASAQFNYISPTPGSKYHNPQATIILRTGDLLDESSIHDKNLVEIYGSKSGKHNWTPVLSEIKTLIIKPNPVFTWDETVSVTVHSLLRRKDGSPVEGTSFSFMIRSEMTADEKKICEEDAIEDVMADPETYSEPTTREECETDSLPAYHIGINNNASTGQIFYNNQNSDDKKDTNSFPVIIENDGTVVWTCDLGLNGHDFKINYNGYITYYNYNLHGWLVLDSNLNTIDTIECGNGYEIETNGHDMIMLPDGRSFLIAYDLQVLDLSQVVPGGKVNATVQGLIVQELDANEEVIFEWRSWDHFQITDANPTVSLTGYFVDYVHGNAVEPDQDGNLLISCRHMSEITKINLSTGDIIWRMGGKNNQFTFVNDNIPEHFAFQHDIRRIANGHVTMLNNGDDLPVQVSSAKEYQLDEINKVATLIWYYQHPKIDGNDVFGSGSGSVQRLSNGSTLISWGKTPNPYADIPNITEVDSNKNITWEFTFDSVYQRSYRAHRYTWNPCQVPASAQIKVKKITANSVILDWNDVNNGIAYDVQYRKYGNTNWKYKTTTKTNLSLKNLTAEKIYEYQVRSHCLNGYASDWTPIDTFKTLPLRLSDTKQVLAFNLYPNPASETLTFILDSGFDQPLLISIYDLSGNLVTSFSFAASEGEEMIPVDVSGLAHGFYLVEVKSGSEKIIGKFIKQ